MPYEYTVNGKRVTLPVNPDKIAVRFREPLDRPQRRAVIDPKPEVGSFDARIEVPREKFTIVDVRRSEESGPSRIAAAADALNDDPAVERVSPLFDLGDRQALATDRIIVGFKPDIGDRSMELISDYGGEIVQADADEYVVRLQPDADPFDVIANLTKHAEVDYAEPDFVTIGQHRPRSVPPSSSGPTTLPMVDDGSHPALRAPDESDDPRHLAGMESHAPVQDPLEQFQYAVRITHADEAWKQVAASPQIRIAILDEGVDVTHPDLSVAIQGAFDAMDNDSDQQPNPWDAHGTACAGLAAGVPNNAAGIRGIGGGCSLLAARIAYSPSPGANWITTNSGIRAAIDWAW